MTLPASSLRNNMSLKVHLVSDVHLEFGKFKHEPPECDLAVLAGDIAVGCMALPWIQSTFVSRNIPTVYVPGNHEFYNRDMSLLIPELEEKCQALGIMFLNNQAVEFNGYTILGTTMWTDFDLYGNYQQDMLLAAGAMNDYRMIKNQRSLITTEFVRAQCYSAVEFLRAHVNVPGKKIVVTHHLPSEQCVNKKYQNSRLNVAFANGFDQLITDLDAVLWCHGHTHSSVDIMHGNTRILCNPRGYVGHDLNKEFVSDLVVAV